VNVAQFLAYVEIVIDSDIRCMAEINILLESHSIFRGEGEHNGIPWYAMV
jgi:hypothetical protein